jgi:cytochrome c oxidase subunit II
LWRTALSGAAPGLATKVFKNMKKMAVRAASLIGGVLAVGPAFALDGQYNFQNPVTHIAEDIFSLHMWMFWICVAIFVAVFSVMFYSVFAHRKSKGAVASTFHESTLVEIAWTIVPVLILVGMAWPATKTVLAMKDTSNPDMTIKATGYQWKWGYDYMQGEGQGISFFSTLSTPRAQVDQGEYKGDNYLLEVDNEVVVPVGKKVRILLTAQDVIHAWWVPALGVKQDAIPGFIRDSWFKAEKEGTFRGNCAELCGKDHGFMPIVVRVVSQQAYAEWVAAKAAEAAAKNAPPAASEPKPAASAS